MKKKMKIKLRKKNTKNSLMEKEKYLLKLERSLCCLMPIVNLLIRFSFITRANSKKLKK